MFYNLKTKTKRHNSTGKKRRKQQNNKNVRDGRKFSPRSGCAIFQILTARYSNGRGRRSEESATVDSVGINGVISAQEKASKPTERHGTTYRTALFRGVWLLGRFVGGIY